MQNIDWNDLRFFLAVAQQGSLLGAAKKLAVNHSTVFRRINRFEDAMGVRVFERLADGYQLTQAGEELLHYAESIGAEVDALQLHLAGKDFKPSGIIRVTAPDNLAYSYLPQYFKAFCKRYPEISIELVVSNDDVDLSRREADVAVRATPHPPEHLIGRKIFSLPWAFYAAQDYLHSRPAPQSQQDLSKHQLIGPDGVIARLPAFRWMRQHAAEAITIRCSNLVGMAALASAGHGIALLPGDQVKPELMRLFVLEPQVTSDIWLLTHPELRRIERIRLLMTHLFDAFRYDQRLQSIAIINPPG